MASWRSVHIEEIMENGSLSARDYVEVPGQGMTFDQWLWQAQHSFWHMTSMQLNTEDPRLREWFDAGMMPEQAARRAAEVERNMAKLQYDRDGNPIGSDDLDHEWDKGLEEK